MTKKESKNKEEKKNKIVQTSIHSYSLINNILSTLCLSFLIIYNTIVAVAGTALHATVEELTPEAVIMEVKYFMRDTILNIILILTFVVLNHIFVKKDNKKAVFVMMIIGIILTIASLIRIIWVYY